ncbi:uncharacterized protein [Elaeis guineensis]|uniref:uncharacterized protein n=1 Tax=Elaeis guineensis var. tenera TaxID=51953 RepID=UPI003C6D0FBD
MADKYSEGEVGEEGKLLRKSYMILLKRHIASCLGSVKGYWKLTRAVLPFYLHHLIQNSVAFFVSFHASFHGFEHGCHPLLFLDRIPLRQLTSFKLLAAAVVDGDDAIFSVAFAVVGDENYDSWQKGLDLAVPRVFEDSHHSYCLQHLIEDFKGELRKGSRSQQLKVAMVNDFICAAEACTIEDFHASIESIRNVSGEAAEWVMASEHENWSDALFMGSRYDHFSSNIIDVFNNWISTKKGLSVVQMVDAIRGKLIEVIETRGESSNAWVSTLRPSMEQKLQKEISGLPCMHAIAVFNHVGKSVYDYCSRYFRTVRYHSTYSGSIHPITDVESIDFNRARSYPRPIHRPPGQPKRKRLNLNKTKPVQTSRAQQGNLYL